MSFISQTRKLWQPQRLISLAGLRMRVARYAHAVVERYHEDMLSVRAMGLTYSTLLSLVPFLAVTFSVLKAFGIQNQIEPFLAQALAPLGPDRMELTRRLVAFVDNTRVGVLGAVGIAGLFYTVIALVGNIEDSLNHIWRAKPSRTWAHRYSEYISLLLIGPVLIFVGFALIASAQSHWLVQRFLEVEVVGAVFALVTRVMPFFFLCAGFTFLYKFVPSAPVRLRSALIGGAAAAVLWQLAAMVFASFVAGSARYAIIYSSFAILVVFLVWLYIAWFIILVGAETAYLHQHRDVYSQKMPEQLETPLSQERISVSALLEITRNFLSAKPPWRESQLSERLGVPAANLEKLLDKFVRSGMLLRSAEPEGIALSRDPENISLIEVLEVLRGQDRQAPPGHNGDSVSIVLQERDKAVRRVLEGITLRSLASEPATGILKPYDDGDSI